jgi:CRP-like cAMP-binding protein
MTRSRRIRALAAAFPHVPASLLFELARELETVRFRPGEVIVREGDPADCFYMIESGQVDATQAFAQDEVHLGSLGPGEFFGEVGLLAGQRRNATVRAVSGVRVLTLEQARFREVVDHSEPTAHDLARVVRDRSAAVEPRADTVALPGWTRSLLRRLLKHPWAKHYNRLIVLVLAANVLFAAYELGRWEHNGAALGTVAAVAQANIALAILFRQQYVINLLGWLATRPPVTWPLRLRWALGKYYHFGGLHVGAALAGTAWYLAFFGLLIFDFASGKGRVTAANVVVSAVVLTLLVVIVMMARPRFRAARHNNFEATHRFCGWAVLALVWLNTVLFVISQARGPVGTALLSAPTVWLLLLTTAGVVWPWLLLRRVPVTVERPSSHVAIVRLDHDSKPAIGTTRAISRSPLFGWHHFANVPLPAGSPDRGYRMTISRAGDWTSEFIDHAPSRVWVRGIPTVDIINIKKLFTKVVYVVTGSGIGPALGHLLDPDTPSRLVWATRDPRSTYGAALLEEILASQPDAIIWNTDELGKPDMLRLAYSTYLSFGAEAVICISNKELTWRVVHGLERRGIPAFGPVWDS